MDKVLEIILFFVIVYIVKSINFAKIIKFYQISKSPMPKACKFCIF